MKIHFNVSALMILSLLITNTLEAQNNDSIAANSLTHRIEMNINPGYVLQTIDSDKGDNSKGESLNTSVTTSLKYAFQFAPDSYFGRFYPHSYQGIGIAYTKFFDTWELGTPVSLYLFQGARIARLSQALTIDYEWNFGAGFGWKPHDEQTNPKNMVLGSSVNAYINLGFYINWRMSSQWLLTAGVNATHNSNGNTRVPNAGLNLAGARLGITRLFETEGKKQGTPSNYWMKPTDEPRVGYDILIYGATRSKVIEAKYVVPGSFGVVGFNVNPMYRVNRLFRAGASLDCQFDESANIENHVAGTDGDGNTRFYRPSFSERTSVGLSLRCEWVMPIFSINIGMGHNVLYKGIVATGFYQILALKTYFTQRLFLHTGYQLSDFHDPKNLMMGLGYTF